jgi:hypothetical protein
MTNDDGDRILDQQEKEPIRVFARFRKKGKQRERERTRRKFFLVSDEFLLFAI